MGQPGVVWAVVEWVVAVREGGGGGAIRWISHLSFRETWAVTSIFALITDPATAATTTAADGILFPVYMLDCCKAFWHQLVLCGWV